MSLHFFCTCILMFDDSPGLRRCLVYCKSSLWTFCFCPLLRSISGFRSLHLPSHRFGTASVRWLERRRSWSEISCQCDFASSHHPVNNHAPVRGCGYVVADMNFMVIKISMHVPVVQLTGYPRHKVILHIFSLFLSVTPCLTQVTKNLYWPWWEYGNFFPRNRLLFSLSAKLIHYTFCYKYHFWVILFLWRAKWPSQGLAYRVFGEPPLCVPGHRCYGIWFRQNSSPWIRTTEPHLR